MYRVIYWPEHGVACHTLARSEVFALAMVEALRGDGIPAEVLGKLGTVSK